MDEAVTGDGSRHTMGRWLARGLAVVAVATVPVVTVALGLVAWSGIRSVDVASATVSEMLVPLAAALGAACGGGLTISGIALALAPARSGVRRRAAVMTPLAWRRLVAIAIGSGVSLGAALPAAAVSDAGWVDPGPRAARAATSDAGWVGQAAVAPEPLAPRERHHPVLGGPAGAPVQGVEPRAAKRTLTHVVTSGDSLWAITAHIRGGDEGEIASAWPELYAANRDVVGADPDLLEPGQVLTIPAGWTS